MTLAAKLLVFLACTAAMFAQTPVVTSVNPNSGQQGTNNLNVAVVSQFADWSQGSTTVSLGAGIAVNSVTVNPVGSDFISQVLGDSPKGFWILNDALGSPASDSSVNVFHGTYGTGVTPRGSDGPHWVPSPGRVASFTGGTISFPAPLNLGPNGYTIEAWINPSVLSLTQTTRIVASGSGLSGYGFGTASGGGLVFTSFSQQDYFTTTVTLLPDRWYYVGVVLDASNTAHFYVNGSLVESVAGTQPTTAPTGDLTFGNQSPGLGHSDEIFAGGVAGVSVYDKALTSAQIQAQYNAATATSLTANISIAANATAGARDLTVTTGSEVVTLTNGFTVTAGTPVIALVNPNSGQQGAVNVPVTITGNFTHFTGASVVTFSNAGVTASAPTGSPTATSLTVNVSVAAGAALGAASVTVTTGSEVVTLTNGFTVTAGTPVITVVNPNSGQQGAMNVPVTITGNLTHFTGASVVTFSNAGVTASAPTGSPTATSLTVNVSVTAGAALGAASLTVTTGGEVVTLTNGFTVTAGTPVVALVNPNSGQQGAVSIPVTITGNFTHFTGASVVTFSNAGVTASAPTGSPTATSLTVNVSVTAAAALGATSVTVTTGSEVVTLTSGFTVTAGTPVIAVVNPNSGQQGVVNVPVSITGNFTHFTGASVVSFSNAGVTASAPTGSPTATSLTVNVSVTAGAAPGATSVTVTTGSEVVTLANGFTVTAGTPVITSVNPNTGQQGTNNLNVVIGGQFTHWTQVGSTVSLGAGITVNSVTVTSAASLSANISIAASATAGARNLTVTTGSEIVNLANAFTVTAATPAISGVSPNTGQQGTNNLNVAVGGQFTNWAQGSTTVSLGAGITVNSVTVSSITSLTANVSIASGATVGARNLTVTTGSEVANLASAFSVTAGAANASGQLAFVQQPTDTEAGATIVPPVTVQLLDNIGNAVRTAGVPVTLALNQPAGLVLNGTATQNTNSDGLAKFGDLSGAQVGTYQLTARSGSLGSATSAAFRITTGVQSVIRTTGGAPQSTAVLTAFAAPLEVIVTDNSNNPIPGVTVVFTAPGTGPSGTFGGAPTASAITGPAGIASARLTANGTPGNYIVSASTAGITRSATFSLTNLAAPPRVLAFVQQPGAAVSGEAISPSVSVQVRDSSGAPVSTSGIAILMTLAAGTGEVSGSSVSVTAANGIATFDNLRIDLAAVKRLRATAMELAPADSNSFIVTAGQASRIAAVGNTPQVTRPFQVFAAPLQALITDSAGNPVSGVPVTFTVPATGPGGSFSGAPAVTTGANGIATSPVLTANNTAGGFLATATSPNVAGVATFPLVIPPPGSPVLKLDEQVLAFVSEIGQSAPPQKTVLVSAVSGATAVGWTASSSAARLTVSQTSGVTPAQVSVNVNPAGLSEGSYLDTVTFTPTAGEAVALVVSYTIVPRPALTVTPGSLIFQSIAQGDGTIQSPSAQTLSTASISRSISYQVSATVTSPSGGTWLQLSATQGQAPGAVQVSVTAPGLSEGIYRGSVLFQPTEAGIASIYVPVTLVVGCNRGGCTAPPAEPPVILGIVNSASFHVSGAPGAAMTIFGRNLSATQAQALVYPLSTILGTTIVTVNGAPVPLYYVSSGQINFRMPSNTPVGSVRVEVNVGGGQRSEGVQSSILTAVDPGLYMNGPRAAALNPDLTPHTAATPQAAGSVLAFYLTGQGKVSLAIPDGNGAPAVPLSLMTGAVQAMVGGKPAEVVFAGLAPDYAGLAQVNVRIPQGLGPGDHLAFIVIDGVPSNAGLISVK